jgi:sec-independent protein translocase protein TatA
MMRLPGGWEWIIVLVIVLLLFGPGRIGKIAGELGKGIKAFREGIGKDKQDGEEQSTDSSGNIEPK